jgi:hypothetical protein
MTNLSAVQSPDPDLDPDDEAEADRLALKLELAAMSTIGNEMASLDAEARIRVLTYLCARYTSAKVPP